MPANKPYIIGLTGGIASGKSVAAAHLESLGAVQIDTDEISRALTASGGEALPDIRVVFGDGMFFANGDLNRQLLGEVVFADTNARRALEGIIHPRVQRIMLDRVDAAAEQGAKIVFLSVPLLFETGMDALCDETWVIYVKPETQLRRVMERDGMSEEDALARIDSQMSGDEKKARATQVIGNEAALERMQAELTFLYNNAMKNRAGD